MSDTLNTTEAVPEGAPADRTLIVERVLRATPDKVFQAWTDPSILVQWFGPEGMGIPECEMDVRPDGRWRTVMANDKGDRHTVSGVYHEISPPDRLVMTWAWELPDGEKGHETEIVVTFEDVPEGTKMRLVQSVFESVESCIEHGKGWESTFNDLGRVFP
jgi:uncharacterized protein YndB with AHSA1/START domain